MRLVLVVLAVACLVLLFLVAAGVGIGFALHWLIPAIEVQFGVLAGVVAITGSMLIFGHVFNVLVTTLPPELRSTNENEKGDWARDADDDSDDGADEAPPVPKFKRGWYVGHEQGSAPRKGRKRR